ncbi:acid-sensing ion channel 2-like [Nematostella vectensis]|uniref:acid-sensing ion channel 2-like n=1 Tax=Nematostella vectensis TaxID=45351 RepID=UPI002076E1EB|nr:acid-sensing ion channel 2-like [Nematostella vectensis]
MPDASTNPENESVGSTILQTFCCNTTLHGVHRIYNSENRLSRLLWVSLLFTVTGYTCKSLVYTSLRFNSYPHTTLLSVKFPESGALRFPAITVCPTNIFMKRKLHLPDSHPDYEKLGLNLTICNETKELRRRFNLTCGEFLLCAGVPIFPAHNLNCGVNVTTLRSLYTKSWSNVPEQFIKAYSASFKETIVLCRYGLYPCNMKLFTEQVNNIGRCFSFNNFVGDKKESLLKSFFQTGTLLLVLNANSKEITYGHSLTEGFRVIVHDQGTYQGFHGGVRISPGYMAFVELRQIQTTFLQSPYKTNCTRRKLTSYSTYTVNGCLDDCFNTLLVENCGCKFLGFPGFSERRTCTLVDKDCFVQLFTSVNPDLCNCRPPCETTSFQYELSTSAFPAPNSFLRINMSLETQRENLAAVQISYVGMQYEHLEEVPVLSVESLFGEVGGILGLMLGCSILTVVEVFELVWWLIYTGFNKRFRRVKQAWAK